MLFLFGTNPKNIDQKTSWTLVEMRRHYDFIAMPNEGDQKSNFFQKCPHHFHLIPKIFTEKLSHRNHICEEDLSSFVNLYSSISVKIWIENHWNVFEVVYVALFIIRTHSQMTNRTKMYHQMYTKSSNIQLPLEPKKILVYIISDSF